MKKGDLVWLPSQITLLQVKEGVARSHVSLQEPTNALLLERGEIYCKVLYRGQTWFARPQDIYELETN